MSKNDKDKGKDERIKEEIKKAGDSVEPADKRALEKIRERTGGSQRGDGKKGKKK
jgi:hypothetical protein